jgi:precorrin-4 C11-methyltransferase
MSYGIVYFVGAGPGAPDLITVRGREVIRRADLIVYADSLVNPAMCADAKPGARIVPSANQSLDEIVALLLEAAQAGQTVVRLHSGDPAIYGATHEQIGRLQAAGVPYEIVPGVSSAFAAAALLGVELTVPEVSQTVIFTRRSGRATPVPDAESLPALAPHGATLVLFLSITQVHRVVEELVAGGYTPDTPAAVVYRVSWPDQGVIRAPLVELPARVREAGWHRQALILVGAALGASGQGSQHSRLYDRTYTHLFRRGEQP